jgi:hypothetical protein
VNVYLRLTHGEKGLGIMTLSFSTRIHLRRACAVLTLLACDSSFHPPMMASNIPVLLCAGSHMWVILNSPNDNTGMWVVEPDTLDDDGETVTSIVHIDTSIRAAHLLPVFGHEYVSWTLSFSDTLDKFTGFYVNKYADHHAFEIAF